ncbi:MAG TPA: secretion protein [Polyangia bacterium]|nr:secretion protein [Polyangia bacterium]
MRRRGCGARGPWALAAVLAVASVGCSTNILHGLDERSANEATAALERAGIGAEKLADEGASPGGASYTIRVAHGDGTRAVDLLRALGLPHDKRRGFAETYGQPSLIPTPSEERARYLDATAGEIERTLETVDGVVSARVHLVLEESDPLAEGTRPKSAARAAVLLKARPGATPIAVADVQQLVAGSVAGLDAAAVGVVVTAAADPAATASLAVAPLGPLRITPGTRPLLVGALAIGLLLLAILAVLLLFTARRLAALERAAARDGDVRLSGAVTP